MGEWINKYTTEMIGSETTIQNQNPGKLIAGVLTEIQERVPNEVLVEDDSTITATLENNILTLGGGGSSTTIVIEFDPSVNGIEASEPIEQSDGSFEITLTVGPYVPTDGEEGQVLVSNGPDTNPSWADGAAGVFKGYFFEGEGLYTISGTPKKWFCHDAKTNRGFWADNRGSFAEGKFWRHTASCGEYAFINC